MKKKPSVHISIEEYEIECLYKGPQSYGGLRPENMPTKGSQWPAETRKSNMSVLQFLQTVHMAILQSLNLSFFHLIKKTVKNIICYVSKELKLKLKLTSRIHFIQFCWKTQKIVNCFGFVARQLRK